MKNRNLILIIIIIGMLFPIMKQEIYAASPLLYIDPITISKEIGDNFSLSVVLDPKGQKVCVAEGSLNMGGLLCNNMNLGNNISYLAKPVCDNSRFILGVQGCTSSKKTLFTIDLEMSSVSDIVTSITGVDIIGVGESISSGSIGSTIISKIAGDIKDIIEQLKNAIPDSQIEKALKEKLQKLLEPVNDVKKVLNWLKDANLGDEAKQILQTKLGQLLEPVNDVKKVLNWLKDANLGDEAKDLLKTKLSELLKPINNADEIAQLLKGVIPGSDIEQILKEKLSDILQPIMDIVEDAENTVDTINNTINDVGDAIENIGDTIDDGKTIIEDIIDFVGGIVDFFKTLGK